MGLDAGGFPTKFGKSNRDLTDIVFQPDALRTTLRPGPLSDDQKASCLLYGCRPTDPVCRDLLAQGQPAPDQTQSRLVWITAQ